jgi:hypothetical protein
MQLPPDRKAYKAANEIVDPDQRVKALQAFLHDFPESQRADAARETVFKLLLAHQPQDMRQIRELARFRVEHADKDKRADVENSVAYELAEAPPNGVDLKQAQRWAEDAMKLNSEPFYTARLKKSYETTKYPVPAAQDLHEYWGQSQAAIGQTLADVYFHEGDLVKASKVLDQVQPLNPTDGSIFVSRGQIAHARHEDSKAVEDLELAEVYGGITAATKPLLIQLYAAQHNGDGSGLDAEIDKRYRSLPAPFTPTPHTAPPTGHTVFVELFTGSGCDPCVAADLGLDGVLEAYPRSEVVALSFDEHIPRPDPLANADTAARASYDSVSATPTVQIDGVRLDDFVGGDRSIAGIRFQAFSKAIDTELDSLSGVRLKLSASLTPARTIAASADVQVTDADALRKRLTPKPAPDKAASVPADKTATTDKPSAALEASKLVLNFALVQKEIHYSGENGVRFHSMVVRAVAKPSVEGFPVAFKGSSTASFTFDPAAVSASLSKYLADFAQHSERFGTIRFRMTDTSLPMEQLAVAAWVEDTVTHHVVAAAFVPVEAPTQEATR